MTGTRTGNRCGALWLRVDTHGIVEISCDQALISELLFVSDQEPMMFGDHSSLRSVSRLLTSFRSERHRRRRTRIACPEALEIRSLLSVQAVTLAASAFQGASAAGDSGSASAFSADSQLIAFASDAGNLTLNDFNGSADIFVRDISSGTITLVSSALNGASGNGPSFNPQLSADGRYVLFESEAKDLVANDSNGTTRDVFVRDLLNQTTTLVSVNMTGGSGNRLSRGDAISQDGRLVVFTSGSSNLVVTPNGNTNQLFVRDLVAGTTTLVSVNFNDSAGGNGQVSPFGSPARLSQDGRFVVFDSIATDMVTNDLNGIFSDVFVRDLQLNATSLVSINDAGTGSGDHQSIAPQVDPTGRYIAFVSRARDLAPGTPFINQIYLRDTFLNTTTHISVDNIFDDQQTYQSLQPVLAFSPDGRYLAYEGSVTELNRQIYVRDLINQTTLLISANRFSDASTSHLSNGISSRPAFSPDSQTIYFASTATDLIDDNTNGVSQIYARHLPTRTTTLLSRGFDTLPGSSASTAPVVSGDGDSLVFESHATNLVADDNNRLKDLFALNISSGQIGLISSRHPLQSPEYTSRTTATDQPYPTDLSGNGRYVTFNSEARDLVTNPVTGRQAYRHDRQSGLTELVSVNPDGSGGNGTTGVSGATAISADGRFVMFGSLDLTPVPGLQYAPGLPGGPRGLFVRDMQLGTTRVINRNAAGFVAGLTGERFTISPDGRFAVFATGQALLAADSNDTSDVYVFDLELNQLSLVSINPSGMAGNNSSTIIETSSAGEVHNIFSEDGRYLAFSSNATDLTLAGGTGSAVYVRDLQTGATNLASVKADGTAAQSFGHAISADGSRLVLVTNARLVAEDTDNSFDVYVRDLVAQTTFLVSQEATSGATSPTISRNGRFVLYALSGPAGISLIRHDLSNQSSQTIHTGSDLTYVSATSDDGRYAAFIESTAAANGLTFTSNLLFFDAQDQTTTFVNLNHAGTAAANAGVLPARPLIDAVGSVVPFSSQSSDLIESDTNGRFDVFAFQRPLGGGSLRGEVFSDTNADGDHDPGEGELAGWRVFLDTNLDGIRQSTETQVVTAANGQYAFTGLLPGAYRIVAEQRAAFVQSAPPASAWDATLVADETVAGFDFGFQQQFADLQVDAIFHSTAGIPGETTLIEWDVSNTGVFDATGSWQDAVYISNDAQLSPDDVLLGISSHTGGLAIGDSYADGLTVTMPAVLPGAYYILIQTDRRGQVPQDNRINDLLASTSTITLDVPELLVDVDRAGTLWGPGLRQYFKVVTLPDRSLTVTLDSLAESGATAIYVSRGALPSPGDFDFRGQSFQPDASLLVPRTVAQSTYYIMVEGQFGEAATAGFTLSAHLPGMKIAQVSPNQGGNTGRVTVRIDGTELTPTTTVQLFDNETTVEPIAIDFRDASHLYATFDLNGASVGRYHLFVFDGTANDLVLNAFEIVGGVEAPLQLSLVAPQNFRIDFRIGGRPVPVVVEVRNNGNTDVVSPILRLSSEHSTIRLAEETGPGSKSHLFLAIGSDGPAGLLRPGQTARVVLVARAESPILELSLEQPPDLQERIDWGSLKASSKPPYIPEGAWDVIWDRFAASAGTTIGDYQSLLARNATYLGQLGLRVNSPLRLADFVLHQADNSLTGSVLTSARDHSLDVPGLPLDFGRLNFYSVSGRYRSGPLGFGWTHNWEVSANVDPQGNVMLSVGGRLRSFTLQSDGSYVAEQGDPGVLTRVNGTLRLREVQGTVLSFRADGQLDSTEDANGNRITAAYNVSADRLLSLTHTSGASLAFSYDNSNGRLVQVTDSTGRSSVYSYDASGEHLVGVTTAQGTLHYEYVPDASAATRHALAATTDWDGTRILYSYDSVGRLIVREWDGGASRVTIDYGEFGHVRFTDATNATTTVLFNDAGRAEFIQDALGRTTTAVYDKNQKPSEITSPDGTVTFYEFCGCGSLLSTTNPLENRVDLTYDPQFKQLTNFQDARGISTSIEIDDRGNATAIDYADGTREQFAHDSQGNVTTWTNRDGQAVHFEYDSSGFITSRTSPGNSTQEFTYDLHGNLLTATDGSGVTTLQYDSAERLTRITYPSGRFLEYVYDASGRQTGANQNGFVVNYNYDAYGRLASLFHEGISLLVEYSYDTNGYLSRKGLGNGTYTTYEYDSGGQLLHLVNHAPDGSVNSRFDYSYDSVGRTSSVVTLEGVTSYGYDLSGQLILVVLPSGRTIRYEYDASGNRIKVTDEGADTVYATNAMNQYTSAGMATFTYDANGNLQTRTDSTGTTTYAFNFENQLVALTGPGGTFTYEYDVFGNRVAEIANGVRREFLIDPGSFGTVVGEYDESGNAVANYAWGLGLVGQFGGSSNVYYDFDALGSTTGLTDAAGTYVNQYSYLPFGETTVVSETVSNAFRFNGQFGVQDRGNGLLDMRMRHYDPQVGQFLSDDPLGISAGDPNLRRFAGNSPTRYNDPTGLASGLPPVDWQSGISKDAYDEMNKVGRKCIPNGAGFDFEEVSAAEFIEDIRRQGEQSRRVVEEQMQALRTQWAAEASEQAIGHPQAQLQRITFPSLKRRLLNGLVKAGGAVCSAGSVASKLSVFGNLVLVFELGDFIFQRAYKSLSFGLLSKDPNDITGPAGFGSENFTTSDHVFPYTIRFENDPVQATAPAQEVFVTLQLDPDLDWTTFELGDVGFGSMVINVPAGRNAYDTRVTYQNQDGSPLLVDFHGALDLATGIVTWTFRSVDPQAGGLPEGVFDGFLPVNDDSARGEGFINYLVRPKSGLVTGTVIEAQASIVFDINDPIVTNTFTNRLDVGAPSATVVPLATVTNSATFVVNWNGVDDASGSPGSGIASFDVFVSDNGGPYSLFQEATTSSSAVFSGEYGHTYRFISIATDHLGFREPWAEIAEATTRLTPPAPVLQPVSPTTEDLTPMISWAAATDATSYDLWISSLTTNSSPLLRTTVSGTSFTPSSSLGIGQFRVWVRSLAANGSASAWSLPVTFRIDTRVTLNSVEKFQAASRPTFSWESLSGSVRYDIWINNTSTGQSQYVRKQNLTGTSWQTDQDLPLGRYRIWIRGIDASGTGARWSIPQDFVVLTRSSPISPVQGTFDRTPEFSWISVPGAVNYELTVVNRNTGAVAARQSGLTSTSWTPTINLPDGPYRWWVMGISGQNLYSLASVSAFFYAGGRTELTAPAAVTSDSTPQFLWNAVDGAVRYELWVNRIGSPTVLIRETNLLAPSYIPSTPLSAGSWRAWIRAVSATGEIAPWSPAYDFNVTADASIPPHHLNEFFGQELLQSVLTGLPVPEPESSALPVRSPSENLTNPEPDERPAPVLSFAVHLRQCDPTEGSGAEDRDEETTVQEL